MSEQEAAALIVGAIAGVGALVIPFAVSGFVWLVDRTRGLRAPRRARP